MKTFLEHLNPTLFIGRFLGLIYFSTDPSTKNIFVKFINFLCYLPFPLFYLRCCLVSFDLHYDNNEEFGKSRQSLLTLPTMISTILKPMYYFFVRNRYKKLLIQINYLNHLIKRDYQNYPNIYRRMFILLCTIAVLLVSDVACLSSAGAYQLDAYFTYCLGQHVGFFDYFMIYTTTGEIHKQFIFVNEQLRNVFQSIQHHKEVKPYTVTNKWMEKQRLTWSDKINTMQPIYHKALDLATEANDLFSFSTLSFVGVQLIIMINSCHFWVSSMIRFATGEKLITTLLIICAYTLFVCLLTNFVAIKIWVNMTKEANKTVTYIHDIWNILATRNKIDNKALQLQLISSQLYNSKLQFTAYGFFALDWTLLHKIVAAVTTYVVILIQFEISSNTKNSS